MSSNRIVTAVAILGVAFLAAYFFYTSSANQPVMDAMPADGSGPKIEITVAGVANGTILIQLFSDVAPKHVERIVALANAGDYNNVVFHRVIDGFMAQTGDVEHGRQGGDIARAGSGGSELPNLEAEFSDIAFTKGVLGMARSASPDSGNSQFFIMFADASHLNGQYTVFGKVIDGLDVLDAIKLGTGQNGSVVGEPDIMTKMMVIE